MTVMVTDGSKRFHGGGSSGPFTWTWRFLANSDLRVYLIAAPNEDDISKEFRILLVEGVDYSVTGAGSYTGGSLQLAPVLAEGADLLVVRMTEPLQKVKIRDQGNNFRPSVHEDVFDRLTMMNQDRDRELAEKTEVINGLKARIELAESTRGLAAADGSGRFFTFTVESGGPDVNGEEILFPRIRPII